MWTEENCTVPVTLIAPWQLWWPRRRWAWCRSCPACASPGTIAQLRMRGLILLLPGGLLSGRLTQKYPHYKPSNLAFLDVFRRRLGTVLFSWGGILCGKTFVPAVQCNFIVPTSWCKIVCFFPPVAVVSVTRPMICSTLSSSKFS